MLGYGLRRGSYSVKVPSLRMLSIFSSRLSVSARSRTSLRTVCFDSGFFARDQISQAIIAACTSPE